jgi:hypothetical protein
MGAAVGVGMAMTGALWISSILSGLASTVVVLPIAMILAASTRLGMSTVTLISNIFFFLHSLKFGNYLDGWSRLLAVISLLGPLRRDDGWSGLCVNSNGVVAYKPIAQLIRINQTPVRLGGDGFPRDTVFPVSPQSFSVVFVNTTVWEYCKRDFLFLWHLHAID